MKRVKREGWRRGGYGVLLQASTRREPATSTARVSSTRVSKQTLHASPLEHLRGGETAIEALTVLSTRALAMEGAWGVTAGCSAAPGPGARLPSIPGTWRQGGEVSGGGECPKRVRIAQNAGGHNSAGSIRSFYTNLPTRWTTSPCGRRTRPPNLLWHGRESRQSIFFLSTFFV